MNVCGMEGLAMCMGIVGTSGAPVWEAGGEQVCGEVQAGGNAEAGMRCRHGRGKGGTCIYHARNCVNLCYLFLYSEPYIMEQLSWKGRCSNGMEHVGRSMAPYSIHASGNY